MSYICKLRHSKNSSSNDHYQNMISTKVVIMNFHEKLRKLLFMFLNKIKMVKNVYKKPKYQRISDYWKFNPHADGWSLRRPRAVKPI